MSDFGELRENLRSDDLVDGRYRVVGRIGSGGMADVYCAEDNQLGRAVALKVLHRRFAADGEFVERFRREASAAAGLQHPNVVQVFDRGSWDGTYYIAMEMLDGESLKALVKDGPLEPALAVDITIQLLRALRFAHRRGIIHRDIKPHNVLVDGERRVKVTDFGIARAGASDMTETGAIMGTAAYLSPEQAQGHAVAATSDLYSAGIVLYELLTGNPPFDAESAVSIALKQVSEDPTPPRELNPEVSPQLEQVVLTALQKDPANRYQDADDFITALDAVRDMPAAPDAKQLTGQLTGMYPAAGALGLPVTGEEVIVESRRRPPWWVWLIAALALVALAIGVALLAQPTEVKVPDVVGQTSSNAAAKLNNDGFASEIQEVRSADRPADLVIRQRPSPGERADEGSQVTIFVSTGPGQAAVPDVVGSRERAATQAITRAGFKPDVQRTFSDSVDAGRVIGTQPEARTPIDIGSTITLAVSRGPERVGIPDVTSQAVEDARAQLERLGFTVKTRRKASDQDPGTVTAQDPSSGATAKRGATVTLTVAEGVDVPGVTGLEQAEASSQLRAAGFEVRVRRRQATSPDEDGQVLDQDPEAGASRPQGATVTIIVGGGFEPDAPDPTATPTPKPTRTPTPKPTRTPTPTATTETQGAAGDAP